jgi:hypothetical protein
MILICAWCQKEVSRDERPPVNGISHTCCQECFDRLLKPEIDEIKGKEG